MRVALFFDGKNHMKDLRRAVNDRWIDHGRLARWVVDHVGGTRMFAAFYYTGVPVPGEEHSERNGLTTLLEDLERRPGFFVHRFNRRAASRECPHCHQDIVYTEEKQVDTSLVADVILHAARDSYDIAVLFSGDADVVPAAEAARSFGKVVWVATFHSAAMSRSLTRAAWSTLDLGRHLDAFSVTDVESGSEATAPTTAMPEEETDKNMLRELRRAELHFSAGGGFVGSQYFLHRWKGHGIPDTPEDRRASVQRLVTAGLAEAYAVDGRGALRAKVSNVDVDISDVTLDQSPDVSSESPAPIERNRTP